MDAAPRYRVAGVDGCRAGWVVVVAAAGECLSLLGVAVAPRFEDVLALTATCAAVAVDIPIGLSEGPPRAADRAARRLLGRGRASSVFPAPVRPALFAAGYVAACEASFAACGRRLSRQTFNILAKIGEADGAMTPALQARVIEAHPEVTFAALNGGPALLASKKTPVGRALRLRLLSSVYETPALCPPAGAALDDVYDAAALCWTAVRQVCGRASRLPAAPPRDARGLRMEIVY